MSKPALFVGSSSEGLDLARAVRALLDEDAEVTLFPSISTCVLVTV